MLRNIAAVAAAGLHPCRLHFALALTEIASGEKRLSAVGRTAWRMGGRGELSEAEISKDFLIRWASSVQYSSEYAGPMPLAFYAINPQ